jgi:hypothetical protein
MYLENNGDRTSSKTRFERRSFMVLQYKFEDHGFQEQLILKKFGIKQNIRVMIIFSNISREVKKINMLHYLFRKIQLPKKIG